MSFEIKEGVLHKYVEEPGITEAVIPEGVTYLNWSAFHECTITKRIVIPSSVVYMGEMMTEGLHNLESIAVSPLNSYFASRDGVLYNKNFTELIFCPSRVGHLRIPVTVIKMRGTVFANSRYLTKISVSFLNLLFVVSDGILYTRDKKTLIFCPRNRTAVSMPDSVTEIFSFAFERCEHLKDIRLSSNLKEIGYKAFSFCTSLKKIVFPASLTQINPYAFRSMPEEGCQLEAVTCRGVEIHKEDYTSFSIHSAMRMVTKREYQWDVSALEKYDLIFKVFFANPDDNFQEAEYLKEHFTEIMCCFIDENQAERIRLVMQTMRNFFNHQNIDEIIAYAIDKQKYEIQLMLTDYKARRIGYESQEDIMKKFEL